MSKAKRFNITVFKNHYSKQGNKTKTEKLTSYEDVTAHKLQLLVGRFVMENPEACVFPKDEYYVYVASWTCDEKGILTEIAFTAKEVAE